MTHARARQEAFRDACVCRCSSNKRRKKKRKMKNKTSIKYMRGRGEEGTFLLFRAKKKGEENTRRTSSTAFRDVRRHPVVSKRGKKETINLRDARYKDMYYICEKYDYIHIHIHYTRIRGSLSVFIRTQHP